MRNHIMKSQRIYNNGNSRLLLIFAGWGCDSALFRNLSHDSYDITVVWDYRDASIDKSIWQGYDEVCVMAWSMGVFAAQQLMPAMDCNLGRRIAVNGTVTPVNDEYGIPVGIFEGTLANLSPSTLTKFQRRMAGGAAAMQAVKDSLPTREVEDVAEELRMIGLRARGAMTTSPVGVWDLAIMSSADAIFPIENQRRAWSGVTSVEIDSPHLPDFQSIIDQFLINKELVSRRFTQANDTYHTAATVQAMISYDLWCDITANIPQAEIANWNSIIEIGSGTGLFTQRYDTSVKNASDWQLWDIAEVPAGAVPRNAKFVQCDAEMTIRSIADDSVDAILSSSALQWLSSPMRFLQECKRVLRKGGILAFSTFDHDNMPEIRALLPGKSLITPSFHEIKCFLNKEFHVIEADSNRYQMLYETPRQVLEHMRHTGVNAIRPASIAQVRHLIENYPRTSTGRCPLTYTPLIFIAKKS